MRSPDETIPERLNLSLSLSLGILLLVALFAIPHAVTGWAGRSIALLLLLPLHTVLWGLIHEAIHGLHSEDRRTNHRAGRWLGIVFGAPFHIVRFGHLMHHQMNRDWDSELYDPASSRWIARAPGYYATLLGGLYAMEVGLGVLLLLPRSALRDILRTQCRNDVRGLCIAGRHPAETYFFKKDRLAETRIDILAALALAALAAITGGVGWCLAFYASRAVMISFLDNIYHYGTPADNSVAAWELRLPRLLSKAWMHFNLHGVHHRHADVPWIHLPARHAAEGGAYQYGFFTMARRQLRGPIASSR